MILFPATPTVKTNWKETMNLTMDLTTVTGILKYPITFTVTLKVKMCFNPRAIGPHDGTGHCCS